MQSPSEQRSGLIYGFAAYGSWGITPLYWALLERSSAPEILAHRMVWSVASVLVLLAVLRRWSWIGPLVRRPKSLALVAVAATTITVNWGMYIWSVNSGHVVEAALGYFINPLVSIAFGTVLLRERLRPLQWTAVGISVAAVAVLTAGYGRPPWIAFTLALSFGTYGLVKKRIGLEGVESFAAETAVQFLPALGFLLLLAGRGDATFTSDGAGHALLLAGCGVVTAAPLIFFGAAAVRLPLSTIGLLQYLTPLLQFVLGLLYFHEHMPAERWAGFALVWLALSVLTFDAFRTARRGRARLRAARTAARTGRETPAAASPETAQSEPAQPETAQPESA